MAFVTRSLLDRCVALDELFARRRQLLLAASRTDLQLSPTTRRLLWQALRANAEAIRAIRGNDREEDVPTLPHDQADKAVARPT